MNPIVISNLEPDEPKHKKKQHEGGILPHEALILCIYPINLFPLSVPQATVLDNASLSFCQRMNIRFMFSRGKLYMVSFFVTCEEVSS